MSIENSAACRDDVIAHLKAALQKSDHFDAPYPHWFTHDLLPPSLIDELRQIDATPPALNGVSGKRELHNDQRIYFNKETCADDKAMSLVADVYQDPRTIAALEQVFSADLNQTYLRIEYAIDATGFWLQPHTDLGVKKITILHYISDEAGQDNLGTDIYNADKSWAKRSPFLPNLAMCFVPGETTYHGFEARPITGLRRSLIVNYVTEDWRDREQLAFPESLITKPALTV